MTCPARSYDCNFGCNFRGVPICAPGNKETLSDPDYYLTLQGMDNRPRESKTLGGLFQQLCMHRH